MQLVDAGMDHRRDMVAAPSNSRSTIAASRSAARLAVVVLDHVVELVGLLQLAPREVDPLLDHAARLGRALPEPPLELVDRAP